MATTLQRGSATIHQFPLRGRFAASGESDAAPTNLVALRAPKTVYGTGWYHDEAIQEAERGRTN